MFEEIKFIKFLVIEEGATLGNQENIFEEIAIFFGKLYNRPLEDSWRLEGWVGLPFWQRVLIGWMSLHGKGRL